MNDIFVDVLGNIVVAGGVVRLEFMRLTSLDSTTKKATYELSHRVVLPLDGFLKSLALQEGIRSKLVADGVIKLEPRGEAEKGSK